MCRQGIQGGLDLVGYAHNRAIDRSSREVEVGIQPDRPSLMFPLIDLYTLQSEYRPFIEALN